MADEQKPKTINEEAGLGTEWMPVDQPPIIPANTIRSAAADGTEKYLTASLPPGYQHDSSFVRTAYQSPNAPQLSLMPLGIQGNPTTNAGIQSTSTKVVEEVVASLPAAAFPSTDLFVLGAADTASLPNSVGNPTAYYGVDAAPASPGVLNDEFNGSVINPKWTNLNPGTETLSVGNSLFQDVAPYNGIGDQLRGLYQAAPATPYTITTKMTVGFTGGATAFTCGLGFMESSSGKLSTIDMLAAGGLETTWWSSVSSFSSHPYGAGANIGFGRTVYLKISNDGTNLSYSFSMDGAIWFLARTEAKNAWFTTGPDRVLLMVDPFGANGFASFEFFRQT